MAYAFQGIPALYAPLPSRQWQRRTATNIMAGCFDPLPALASDSGRDDSSSQGSILTGAEEEIMDNVMVGVGRAKKPARRSLAPKKALVVKSASATVSGKGKQVRRAMLEEKENAMSDSDSGASLSPVPPPSTQKASVSADVVEHRPKASGFWRARSSNTPEGSSAALKRKRSSLFDDSSSSPANKKPRHSPPIGTFVLSESESLTSLEADSRDLPVAPEKSYAEKFSEAILAYTEPIDGGKPDWVCCKMCSKVFESRFYIEKHFKLRHPTVIAHLDHPPLENEPSVQAHPSDGKASQQSQSAPIPQGKPAEEKKRAARKNVAVKKGWKGWVEEDLEPQKLILLDKPEVLPERTTRSGRRIF